MSENKVSSLEHSAILKKRGEFVHEIERALQPIFAKYTGHTNSGTYASRVAQDALTRHKSSIDESAVSELVSLLEFLSELRNGVQQ